MFYSFSYVFIGLCRFADAQRSGLGDGREIYILSPERQPNRITKDEIMNKKSNEEILALTIAETFTTAHC